MVQSWSKACSTRAIRWNCWTSEHHVIDCETPRIRLRARFACYQSRPNGRASEIRSKPLYLCGAALRKCAYHFLLKVAASFLTTHRSTTQINHNAIRNPTTGRSNPMSFQKDLAPPGIYDGTCVIAKSTS